jgi:Ca2+-binding RTX toxin-like protein
VPDETNFSQDPDGVDVNLGGSGAVVLGSQENDNITATGGADTVCGLGGDDEILGQGGDDTLLGGEGNDILDGGGGDDTFNGGPGADTFNCGGGTADNVEDFDLGEGDTTDGNCEIGGPFP